MPHIYATALSPFETASIDEADQRRPLTDKQQRILTWIRDHITLFGYPPAVREIGAAFNLRSPNGVMCHLKALEAKGWIERDHTLARGIRIRLDPGEQKPRPKFLGRISAGGLFEAIGNDGAFDLEDFLAAADSFVVVDGDELEQRLHLKDGDQLLFGHGRCVGMVRLVR